MWRTYLLWMTLLGFGCSSPLPDESVSDSSVGPSAKEILTEIAKTGELSGETHVEEEIEKIRATDPKHAGELQKEFGKLSNLEEPGQIKRQAQKLIKMFK